MKLKLWCWDRTTILCSPPYDNDARRREDPEWLGPHIEINIDLLEGNLKDALAGADKIDKPLIETITAILLRRKP